MSTRTNVIIAGLIIGSLCIAGWASLAQPTSTQDVVGDWVFGGDYYLTAPRNIAADLPQIYIGDRGLIPTVCEDKIVWQYNTPDYDGINLARAIAFYDMTTGQLDTKIRRGKELIQPSTSQDYATWRFIDYIHSPSNGALVERAYNNGGDLMMVENYLTYRVTDMQGSRMATSYLYAQTGGFRVWWYDIALDYEILFDNNVTIDGGSYRRPLVPSIDGNQMVFGVTNKTNDNLYLALCNITTSNETYVLSIVENSKDGYGASGLSEGNVYFNRGGIATVMDVSTGNEIFTDANVWGEGWLSGEFITGLSTNGTTGNEQMELIKYDTGERLTLFDSGGAMVLSSDYGMGHNIYEYSNGTLAIVYDTMDGGISLQFLIPEQVYNEQLKEQQQGQMGHRVGGVGKYPWVNATVEDGRGATLLFVGCMVFATVAIYAMATWDRTKYREV